MAKTKQLVDCIKSELRTKGLTYKKLSERLKITESAVKHMFSNGNFSLERLDEISDVLEVDMSDLVALTVDREPKLEHITPEQETELVQDMKLFIVAYAVINYWSFEDILARYEYSEIELTQYLLRLEKIGFLELHVNNRITPKVSNNFSWHPDGSIEKLFQTNVLPQFFKSSFSENDSLRVAKSGEITEKSRLLLAKRISALGDYFDELCFNDRHEELDTGRTGSSLVMGVREWSFSPFLNIRND